VSTLRHRWDVLNFLKKKPSTTKEIVAHYSSHSAAIVMVYLEALRKEGYVELKNSVWHAKLEVLLNE
jgi:predicted transcriptional regulator